MSKQNKHISNVLLLDDDENTHKLVRRYMDLLEDSLGMKIYHSLNLKDAKHIVEDYNIDYIISDFLIHDNTILEFIEWLDSNKKIIPIDCITSIQDTDLIERLSNLGVKNIIYKPISIYNFIQLVYKNLKIIQGKYKEVNNEIQNKQR